MLNLSTENTPRQEKKLLKVCQYCFEELDENKKPTGRKILPDEAGRLLREDGVDTTHGVCVDCYKKTRNEDGTLNIAAVQNLVAEAKRIKGVAGLPSREEISRKTAEFKAEFEAEKARVAAEKAKAGETSKE